MHKTLVRPRSLAVVVGAALALAVVFTLSTSSQPIVPSVTAASSDYFLKLDDIEGESSSSGHAGEIEILSWSWGASNPVTVGSGAGGLSGGKVSYSDLSVMKRVDKSTPKLFLACASGQHLREAKLSAPGPRGGDYYHVTIQNVTCTSLEQSGSSSDRPMESISFTYDKIIIEYKAPGSTTWETVGWDLATGKKI